MVLFSPKFKYKVDRFNLCNYRVRTAQGKPGKPGKRDFFEKNQGKPGKLREFSDHLQPQGKLREFYSVKYLFLHP